MRCLACIFGFTPRRKRMSKAFIGTSGRTYDSWRGRFYLENLRKRDWLAWYASQFPTTEINGSFYRAPSLDAARTWRDQTPPAAAAAGGLRLFWQLPEKGGPPRGTPGCW